MTWIDYETCPICGDQFVYGAAHDCQSARCSICGDPLTDPVDCPDRHGWDDHGLCCVGACHICKGEIL